MKVTANGYGRNVVGSHTLTEADLSQSAFFPTDDGVEIYVSRSKKLALGGHFRLHIFLSTRELREAMHSATVRRLEKRIEELETKLSNT